MGLKSAVFEMKEAIMKQRQDHSEEALIKGLEEKNGLGSGILVYYYNHLLMFHLQSSEDTSQNKNSKKTNRKWTKNEVEFMFHYIKERQEEGGLNITDLLEEVSQLLNRGYQSVNYKYYSAAKAKDRQKQELHFTTIEEESLPVLGTQLVSDQPAAAESAPAYQLGDSGAAEESPGGNDDLLDILSGLITNVQKLPGINLNELLKSLYMLTNMAIQNQDAVQQLESVKTATTSEKQALEERLLRQEQQLLAEKKRNEELQAEVAKLAREISAFSKLEDTAKIQNLKSYNQRLNYLIDRSGVVMQVGS